MERAVPIDLPSSNIALRRLESYISWAAKRAMPANNASIAPTIRTSIRVKPRPPRGRIRDNSGPGKTMRGFPLGIRDHSKGHALRLRYLSTRHYLILVIGRGGFSVNKALCALHI